MRSTVTCFVRADKPMHSSFPSSAHDFIKRSPRTPSPRSPEQSACVRLAGKRKGHGPRLQDLRHRFATRKLIDWYRAGFDVEREMPKLATYLGHVHVRHTYWYIEAVPELLQLATERLSLRRQEVKP